MFAWWGRTVYRYRFIVIGVMVALCLAGGVFGMSLGKHVTQSGFYDDGSESVKGSQLADDVYGRDRTSHVVGILSAPSGKTVDDPDWSKSVVADLDKVKADNPDEFSQWYGYFRGNAAPFANADKTRAFVYITLKGDNDDQVLQNYRNIKSDLQKVDDGNIELAGLQPLADELTGTIAKDQQRAEMLALPLVAVVLFFVFGGVVAATLPVMVGGLSIAGALGILRLISLFGPVHFFAQPVVTLIGLGIAIDYGLFVVSRFREELAEGYDTEAAVRRTVMTSGRTVVFSAVIIVASAAGLLLFPQGFLKSITYAVIASVLLSAALSITVLPAVLGILGRHVDALGISTLLRVPFLRNWKPTNWWLNFLADKTQKTKTREEVETGFWGKLVNWVMKRPILFAVPIVIVMILLVIPLGKLSLGGISEKYLPPDNSVRNAQEDFDRTFPDFRTQQLMLVVQNSSATQLAQIKSDAEKISGFTKSEWTERPVAPDVNNPDAPTPPKKDPNVTVFQNGLKNPDDVAKKIQELRNIQPPKGVTIWVGGTPALEQDSIHSLFDKLPLMAVILITTTTLLMFLAFGSLVLPIKAAVMSALTLFSTMGMLTWIFVEGHLSKQLNFTPTPLMAPMIGLIIAVVYGLSTDYEVFLVSRMVEARERGMSTAEAIRIGTATTGRLITAAALILVVVAGAFAFSDLVMLKYLAFGLITALILDATIIRMFLVPAIMKLLGDDCWWAPRWMRRLQNRLGLGEIELPDERKRAAPREPEAAVVGASASVAAAPAPRRDPTHPGVEGATRRTAARPGPKPRSAPRPEPASAADTTRIPAPRAARATEPPTTRLSTPAKSSGAHAAKNNTANNNTANNNTATSTQRTYRPAPPPPREDREIESWLGELRGSGSGGASGGQHEAQPPAGRPAGRAAEPRDEGSRNSEKTTAIPTHRTTGSAAAGSPADDATKAIPVRRGDDAPETEKLRTKQTKKERADRPRRQGGVSAQEVLRREGRL